MPIFNKLSVLIPVFNEKKTIKKCVENVLKADTCGLELEIIISDNNSTDGTIEILKSLQDERIVVLYKKKIREKEQILEMLYHFLLVILFYFKMEI